MRFDIITIFPEMMAGLFTGGVAKRALEKGLLQVFVHDLRDYTHDRHRQVDDRPFGGGEGMVLKPEPIFEAVEAMVPAIAAAARPGDVVVAMSNGAFGGIWGKLLDTLARSPPPSTPARKA